MQGDWENHSKVMLDSVNGYSEMLAKLDKSGKELEAVVKEVGKNISETPKAINDMLYKTSQVIERIPAQYREGIEEQTTALEHIRHLLRKDHE